MPQETKTIQTIDMETLMATSFPPCKFIVEGLLPCGLNLWCGQSKIGKSWLMLWLCICVANGEAFCFECVIKRVVFQAAAVHAEKYLLSGFLTSEGHVIPQPAFNPTALIVIAAGTFHAYFGTAAETIDIKLAHIIPNPLEILDQLTVFHSHTSFLLRFFQIV